MHFGLTRQFPMHNVGLIKSKNMKNLVLFIFGLLICNLAVAQETFPQNDVYDERDGHYAFTNATIFKSYNSKLEGATLVIKNGKVVSVGKSAPPKGAVVVDLNGKYIYPSFIDLYTGYGLPAPEAVGKRPRQKPYEFSLKTGAYAWNEALKPEASASTDFNTDDKKAKDWRKQGFGSVLTHHVDGIARGTGALVFLGRDRAHEMVIKDKVSSHLSFKKGKSTQDYPGSLMGAIALLRQTYLDADWYKKQGSKEEYNKSLAAWNDNLSLKQIFDVRGWQGAMRADKIAKEFGHTYIMKGTGHEYQRAKDLKGLSYIIPVNFPKAYDMENPYYAKQITLHQMKHWEMAPANPKLLHDAGIEFSFTLNGLESKDDFLKNIREAVKYGLSEEAALKALTATPASQINMSSQLGSLETGKIANFIITSDNIFKEKTTVHHNWIKGEAYVLTTLDKQDLTGKYNLLIGRKSYDLQVTGTAAKPKMKVHIDDSTKVDVNHKFKGNLITLAFEPEEDKGWISLNGIVKGTKWSGNGTGIKGGWLEWSAKRTGDTEADKKDKKEDDEEEDYAIGNVIYPFMPYGNEVVPTQGKFLIQNATVWTNESDGILEDADVLIQNGKISNLGKDLSGPGCTIIDGTGKHVTSGIIDEHSHIAIQYGVNEWGQNSSAEVRIGDVVKSEDVNIYRQLAGGVTMAQLLHGSANPIGGQSALIKMRWGYNHDDMKVANAPRFIKFALGENVKQSNWGEDSRSRFPQTRMGVEQVYYDHFTRGQEYSKALKSGKPVRRDLETEAMMDIVESRLFITCHSYVQSEINMLMKTAEAFDFKINTFTHILEGYKVADKMYKHGAGGSTFSDWWAYKYEVIDAIPYNGAILNEQNVLTAFNSDDAEMGRRLNQEAAKAVMYGNVSEEDAWKFVTLNPAKLLRVDDQVGSLKSGKDADVVVWSNNPLSIYAQAEYTFVDGILFFSKEIDAQKRLDLKEERTRLIQKMIQAKKDGKPVQKPKPKKEHLYHCDHIEDENSEEE